MITRVPLSACPTCGRPSNGADGITEDEAPKPGDFGLCISCGELLVYTEALDVRRCEPEELDDPALTLADRRALLQAQRLIRRRGRLPFPRAGGRA